MKTSTDQRRPAEGPDGAAGRLGGHDRQHFGEARAVGAPGLSTNADTVAGHLGARIGAVR